jgi:WD40 repeat protein/transcriptional regulator with XRE-family HTH domain
MNQDITFGQAVKERRDLLGLTQAELGRRVGCAAITIRRIEADNLRPSVQVAEHLAIALGVSETDYLAFVRLARTPREPSPLPTPPPIREEIGLEDLSGRAIRGYQLGERIGSGGYGVVYRAVQATVNREVAVKIILPQYADRPEFIRRFEAEAQLVARLEHPHIVPLYDYWREPGVAYLVMRLLRGGNLAACIKEGPLAPERLLPWLEQICAGLYAAHQAGVIHRDVKPANILLDDADNAYLADFGIAKITSNGHAGETLEGLVLGSPAYISPEQILVEPVKPQSDVYSLGVMLYELLAGRKPFDGPTPFALIQQHLNEPFPSLAAHSPDLPPALDRLIQRATAKDQAQRYPDVLSLLADFRNALVTGDRGRETGQGSHPGLPSPVSDQSFIELTNPYKGLRAFGEADAADFFGREMLVQELLARLAEATGPETPTMNVGGDLARFLAVVGPSGSGKSSVVRAGLIPALRQGGLPGSDQWFIVEMLPGTHPWEELETALLRVAVNPPKSLLAQLREDERGLLRAVRRILPADEGVELVLIIDQFEELFTLTTDEPVRSQFLNALVTAILDSRSRLRLVITLRADFTDRPLQYVDFGELLRQRTEFVLPLTPDELEQAILGPARRVGLSLEPGLVATISREVGQEPGALPLLQYALTELFERSTFNVQRSATGPLLTKAAYDSSGGVSGALTRRADELYHSLDTAGQEAARQLFLRLVTLGEGTEDTRRRVLRVEVEALMTADHRPPTAASSSPEISVVGGQPSAVINEVIDTFGRYRLLSFDRDPVSREPTVEVAHEALLREWGQLRDWLDTSRNDIRLQRLLATAAAEWREANQDASFLLHGTRLEQFVGWAGGTSLALTPHERIFLEASLAERQARQAEEEARRQRELETAQKLAETEKRAAWRFRWLAVGLAVLLIAAAGLAVFAFNRQAEAVSNLALSESQRLAAEANTIMQGGGNMELAALLSLRALNTAYTPQADMALQQASKGDYGRRLLVGHTNSVNGLAFSPNGRLALSGSNDQTARLWDVETGQLLRTLTGHTAKVTNTAFSPDGQTALTSSDDKTARLWNVQTGQQLLVLTCPEAVSEAVFSPDGRYALTGSFDGTLQLWNLQQKGQAGRVFQDAFGVLAVAFSPDGQSVLTGNVITSDLRLWSVATGQEMGRFTGATGGVWSVAFSSDGHYILASDADGGVRRWDLRQLQAEPLLFAGHTDAVHEVKVSPDGRYALSASDDGTAWLWDIETGQEVRRFAGTNPMTSVAFSPDGQTVLLGNGDGLIRLWNVQPPADPATLSGHTHTVMAAEFSPDGRYVLTGSTDETARLWDVETGRTVHVLADHTEWVDAVAFSPDGRYALTAGDTDRTARVWDVETGQVVRVLTHGHAVFDAAFSPDGRYVTTAGDDSTARLWDLRQAGQEVRAFPGSTGSGPLGRVLAVAFSPNGQYLLTGNEADDTVRLWEVQTGREVRQFPGFRGGSNSLAFSPDGQSILTPIAENSSQLWSVATGQPQRVFSGSNSAFSPDGKYLLTGGLKTAYLWDMATGRQIRAFGSTQSVWAVAISPDNQLVLIAGSDKVAHLWDADYHKLVASVCARVLRDFTAKERELYGLNDQQPTCPVKN